MDNELLAVACMPGLSHGSFRLYTILMEVERGQEVRGKFFPVTLLGLQKVHPGTSGKVAGFTTIIKQVSELRQLRLLETRAPMPRNEPELPILVRLIHVDPEMHRWVATDGSELQVRDVGRTVTAI